MMIRPSRCAKGETPSVTQVSGLVLTREQALALLDMCLMSPIALNRTRKQAILRLAAFCRDAFPPVSGATASSRAEPNGR